MSKVWICEDCGNTNSFIAYGSIPVRCVVGGDGSEILESEPLLDCDPDPDWPEECAECGGWHIKQVEEEETSDDNNEFITRRR